MAGKNETSIGVKLTADSTQFERIFKSAGKTFKQFEAVLIGALGLEALELGKKGWETYKQVMESTEGTAEKLEQQIATLNGAMSGLVKTIATGSWESLISNITNTAEATKKLTAATQEYEHAKVGTSIKLAEKNLAFQEARVNAMESTDPATKAKFLQEAIDLRREITAIEVEELTKRSGITKEYYAKLTGYDEKYFTRLMEWVPSIAKEYDYYLGENSVVLQGAKARLADIAYGLSISSDPKKIAAYKTEQSQLLDLVHALEDYRWMMDDLSKKDQWDEFVRGLGEITQASAEGEAALVRLVKQLSTAQTKAEKAIGAIDRVLGPAQAITHMPSSFVASFFGKQKVKGGGLARGGKDLAGFNPGDIPPKEELKGLQDMVNQLEGAFSDMFVSVSSGSRTAFEDMARAFERAILQMAATLAAKTIVFGFLNLISGGLGSVASWAGGIVGKGLGNFLGFAEGTNFAPGGLALVGERGPELVNLPRGSQVIPNKNLTAGGEVVFRIEGNTLVGVLNNTGRQYKSFR